MGFKKNKANKVKEEVREESRVSSSMANSQATSTVVYNSNQSVPQHEKVVLNNNYLMDKSRTSQVSEQSRYTNKAKT